ncbi:hypothetical protein K8I28_09565 [bacterium]|nr:hypothetical protein [bacterium]
MKNIIANFHIQRISPLLEILEIGQVHCQHSMHVRQTTTALTIIIAAFLIAGCAGTQKILPPLPIQPEQEELIEALRYLQQHPDDRDVRMTAGNRAIELKDTLTAIYIFEPIAADLEEDKFRRELIELALKSGSLEFAQDMLQKELVRHDQSSAIRHKLSLVEKRIRMADEAARDGRLKMAVYNWKDAYTAFRTARHYFAANPEYRAKLKLVQAEILVKNKMKADTKKALRFIKEAKTIWQNEPLPYWVEGDVYIQMGKTKKAKKAFQRSLELGIKPPFALRAKMFAESQE